jgi:hypothetical protein
VPATISANDPNGTVWGQLFTSIASPTFSVIAGQDAGGGIAISAAGVVTATSTPLAAGAYTFTARAANAGTGQAVEQKISFTVGAAVTVQRNIGKRMGWPTRTSASGGSVQEQGRFVFQVVRAVTGPKIRVGNFAAISGTAPTSITKKLSFRDSNNAITHPITFSAASTVTIPAGTSVLSDVILNSGTGQPLVISPPTAAQGEMDDHWSIIQLTIYASDPTNYPASGCDLSEGGNENSEKGTTLTDRTSGSPAFSTADLSGYTIEPPLSIVDPACPTSVYSVAILCDSIFSDGANDTANSGTRVQGAWARALETANIPYVQIGYSGLALSQWLGAGNATHRNAKYAQLTADGITHVICGLGTNDLNPANGPSSGATILANYVSLKAQLAALSPPIKLIVSTLQPRTNAGNTAEAAGEVGVTFAQRAIVNSAFTSSPGTYAAAVFDMGSRLDDQTLHQTWRLDINAITAAVITSGGAGHGANNWVDFGFGIRYATTTVVAGAATVVTKRQQGGALTGALPANPVSQILTSAGGTGLQLTFTWATTSPTGDGVHPTDATHNYAYSTLTPSVLAQLLGASSPIVV